MPCGGGVFLRQQHFLRQPDFLQWHPLLCFAADPCTRHGVGWRTGLTWAWLPKVHEYPEYAEYAEYAEYLEYAEYAEYPWPTESVGLQSARPPNWAHPKRRVRMRGGGTASENAAGSVGGGAAPGLRRPLPVL